MLYPITGRPSTAPHGQHELAWAVTGRRKVAASVWVQLTTELRTSELNRTLISAEDFSSMATDQIAVVRDLLDGFNVKVIAYVRDPFDFMVSAYGQQITSQTGYSGSFSDFVQKNLPRCDYESLAQNWSRAFGDAAVRIRSFDHARSVGLARDFCDATGVLPSDKTPPEASVRNSGKGNKSLSWFRTLNRLEARLPSGRTMRPVIRKLRRLSRFGFGNANAFQSELDALETSVVETTNVAAARFAARWLPLEHQTSFLRRYK
jgi:hypothetical protein